jgi:hypothetical protein
MNINYKKTKVMTFFGEKEARDASGGHKIG